VALGLCRATRVAWPEGNAETRRRGDWHVR